MDFSVLNLAGMNGNGSQFTNLISPKAVYDLDNNGLEDVIMSSTKMMYQVAPNNFDYYNNTITFDAIGGIGDVDGNGLPDILMYTYSNTRIIWNNGFQDFTSSENFETTYGDMSMAMLQDFENDGDLDIMYVLGNTLKALVNEGNGTWEGSVDIYTFTGTFKGFFDFDGDEDLDALFQGNDADDKRSA
jgi:hypothetical protein